MGEIKFRQRNVNNGQFHIWGMDAGIWRNPLWQDNYVHPQESDQYTGLKDKNGKESYHKDRMRFLTIDIETGVSDEWTGTIEWDDEDLCWYILNDSDKWPVVKFRFVDYFEIIGNTYENTDREV